IRPAHAVRLRDGRVVEIAVVRLECEPEVQCHGCARAFNVEPLTDIIDAHTLLGFVRRPFHSRASSRRKPWLQSEIEHPVRRGLTCMSMNVAEAIDPTAIGER